MKSTKLPNDLAYVVYLTNGQYFTLLGNCDFDRHGSGTLYIYDELTDHKLICAVDAGQWVYWGKTNKRENETVKSTTKEFVPQPVQSTKHWWQRDVW